MVGDLGPITAMFLLVKSYLEGMLVVAFREVWLQHEYRQKVVSV